MTTTQTPERLTVRTARDLGYKAFINSPSTPRIPDKDPSFREKFVASAPYGDGFTYGMMRAWTAGYDAARISVNQRDNDKTDTDVLSQIPKVKAAI